MRKTKIAAIVAAAAVLVLGMAFTSMAAAKGWVLEEDGWTWQDADGNRVFDGKAAKITASINGINPCAVNNNGADFVTVEI